MLFSIINVADYYQRYPHATVTNLLINVVSDEMDNAVLNNTAFVARTAIVMHKIFLIN